MLVNKLVNDAFDLKQDTKSESAINAYKNGRKKFGFIKKKVAIVSNNDKILQ